MTRLVNEEQAFSSNSDSSCTSSRAGSQCFDLDGGKPTEHQREHQQHQKRLKLNHADGELEQIHSTKRIALEGVDEQRVSGDSKLNHLQEDSNKPKRNPFCSRCRNHGKIAQVKGHKRHCDYRDCQCEGCKLVECRQIVSARQIKLRRNQKQDEEYGRRIEVSPPVLRPDSNNDSVTIFARTLIGAASPATSVPHFKTQHGISVPDREIEMDTNSTTTVAPSKNRTTSTVADLSSVGKPSGSQKLAFQDTTGTSDGGSISSTVAGYQHQLHLSAPAPPASSSPSSQVAVDQMANQRLMAVAAAAAAASNPNCDKPSLNPALAIPFHLFNLPGPVLSQAAAAATSLCNPTQSIAIPTTTPTNCTGTDLSPASSAPTRLLPSLQEQIHLVDEIHHMYGPLAIYAWLKYEHFDLQKIRDLVELSRSSYDNLLNLKLMSHLATADHHSQPTTSTTAPTTTVSVSQSLLSQVRNIGANISLPVSSSHSNSTSMVNLHHQQPTVVKTSSCSGNSTNTSFPSSAFSTPSSSLMNSYHNMNRDVRTTLSSCSGGTGGYGIETPSVPAVPTTANHHNMSLASTLNSLAPMSSSDFLWTRDPKVSSPESLCLIQPGHLLSRFMHYQHFGGIPGHNLRHHHHLNLQHHHHEPLSPPPLFVSNLSMQSSSSTATSSSSTTLL